MKTVSLDLAKQLHEAGIIFDTEYEWFISKGAIVDVPQLVSKGDYPRGQAKIIPAPNTDELLEWLPTGISIYKKTDGTYTAIYAKYVGSGQYGDSAANALALMALWVAKNSGETK